MNTKIAMSFGLALVLVMGVIATIFLLNPKTASATATISNVLATPDTTDARNTVSQYTVSWTTTENYAPGFVATIDFPGGPTTGVVTPAATVVASNIVHAFGTGVDAPAARTAALAALPGAGGGTGSPVTTSVAAGTNTVTLTGNAAFDPPAPDANTIVAVAVRFFFAAGIINLINDTGSDFVTVDTDQGGEVAAPPVASDDIAYTIPAGVPASTGAVSPTTAGQLAEHTFTFTTAAAIPANTGEVRVTFDKDVGIPAAIAASDVLMRASLLTNVAEGPPTCPAGTGGANQIVPLALNPSFDDDTIDPRRTVVILKVPDMNPLTGTGSCGAGVQGIGANALVTVTFTTGAGITNQTEGGTEGTELVACATACVPGVNTIISNPVGEDTVAIHSVGLGITRDLKLSTVNGGRGTTVTVVGRGFKDGTTATVWLDADGDNDRDPDEADLGTTVIGSDDTFTITFTVTNPPFIPGQNTIAAVDGRNNKVPTANLPQFELRGSVTVTPTTVAQGDTITVQLKDFDTLSNLASAVALTGTDVNGNPYAYPSRPSLRLGGVSVNVPDPTTTDANGEVTFTTTVPNSVALGVQALEVRNICCLKGAGTHSTRRTNLTITVVECVPPATGHWEVTQNCTLTGAAQAPGKVIVEEGVALTIAADASLDIDFSLFHLLIKNGAKVIIKSGGKIH